MTDKLIKNNCVGEKSPLRLRQQLRLLIIRNQMGHPWPGIITGIGVRIDGQFPWASFMKYHPVHLIDRYSARCMLGLVSSVPVIKTLHPVRGRCGSPSDRLLGNYWSVSISRESVVQSMWAQQSVWLIIREGNWRDKCPDSESDCIKLTRVANG